MRWVQAGRSRWRPAAVVVGYFTFDPYYEPSHRRFSYDAGSGEARHRRCDAAALTARYRPRAGMLLTLVALFFCIPTAFLGAGH